MRVNLGIIEITDEQRGRLAWVLDGGVGRDRLATRAEVRNFVLTTGSSWPEELDDLSEDADL